MCVYTNTKIYKHACHFLFSLKGCLLMATCRITYWGVRGPPMEDPSGGPMLLAATRCVGLTTRTRLEATVEACDLVLQHLE